MNRYDRFVAWIERAQKESAAFKAWVVVEMALIILSLLSFLL